VAELDLGEKVTMELPKGRQAYLLCIEGEVQVQVNDTNGTATTKTLKKHDGCEISSSTGEVIASLEIEATQVEDTENGPVAHILMFTMEDVPGSGRKDI
jgi:redox-sensitive bicupin YhaK (pirin superfamily)